MVGGLLGRLRAPADPARLSVSRLSVAGVTLERAQEPLHLLAVGSTGTGKTTLMTELMDGLVERGDRLIVVDPNGSYLSAFHRDGDTVLNPFDSRSPGWWPFTEVRRAYDFDKLARNIVPDGHGPDAAWHFFGQTLVSAVMRSLREDDHLAQSQPDRGAGSANGDLGALTNSPPKNSPACRRWALGASPRPGLPFSRQNAWPCAAARALECASRRNLLQLHGGHLLHPPASP